MTDKNKTVEALTKLIQECVKASLLEGTIGGTVIEPLKAALEAKDIEKARKIFKMSLSQFSADEIADEIARRIEVEKNDARAQFILKALEAQYAAKRGAGVRKPSDIISQFQKDKVAAGSGADSLPIATASRVIAENDTRPLRTDDERKAGNKYGEYRFADLADSLADLVEEKDYYHLEDLIRSVVRDKGKDFLFGLISARKAKGDLAPERERILDKLATSVIEKVLQNKKSESEGPAFDMITPEFSALQESEKFKTFILNTIMEIASGLKHGSSAGLDARVAAMKAKSDAKKSVGNQAPKIGSQPAPAAEEPGDVVASEPAKRKPVPPPIPVSSQKPAARKPATPPPVPAANYAGQVKKVAMNEEVIRNLIKAIMMQELAK